MARKKNYSVKDQFDKYWRYTPSCWIWVGAKRNKSGYGCLTVHQKMAAAHRLGYELYVGPIPDGAHLRHICDNPSCVNPYHLIPGTHKENMQDRMERTGWVDNRGSKHGMSKLTEPQVAEILKDTRTHQAIADTHGISCSCVTLIKNGQRWRHVKEALDSEDTDIRLKEKEDALR